MGERGWSRATWTKHLVDGSFGGAYSVYAADVDGDGDADLLGAAFDDNAISWWENVDGGGTMWIEHLVGAGFLEALSVHAADLDGDGDVDALGAAEGADAITWWENVDGTGTSWVEYVIAQEFDGARFVSVAISMATEIRTYWARPIVATRSAGGRTTPARGRVLGWRVPARAAHPPDSRARPGLGSRFLERYGGRHHQCARQSGRHAGIRPRSGHPLSRGVLRSDADSRRARRGSPS